MGVSLSKPPTLAPPDLRMAGFDRTDSEPTLVPPDLRVAGVDRADSVFIVFPLVKPAVFAPITDVTDAALAPRTYFVADGGGASDFRLVPRRGDSNKPMSDFNLCSSPGLARLSARLSNGSAR